MSCKLLIVFNMQKLLAKEIGADKDNEFDKPLSKQQRKSSEILLKNNITWIRLK